MDEFARLEIPTPFHVESVNCYVFTGDGLALLDPGPSTEAAYETITAELESRGLTVADVETVLVTHPHMDHFGLADRIVSESGARVVAHRDATRRLGDPDEHLAREQTLFERFLPAMGVPDEVTETAVTLPDAYRTYRDPLDVDHEVTDGDSVDVGVELTAIHTPGHAPGSVCFVHSTGDVAFTGDHVLADITPNPLLTVAPGSGDQRTRSLPTYIESLRRLFEVEASVGHGGHGGVISDLDARVQEIIDHHHDRAERIAGILDETGPTTAYEVMQRMFPDLPATEIFPGISEVVGHLDVLEDQGRVEITATDGVDVYASR